jgi:hypothetical protein
MVNKRGFTSMPDLKKVTFCLSGEDLIRLQAVAKADQKTMSAIVRDLVRGLPDVAVKA